MKKLIIIILLIFSNCYTYGQYDFEKYKPIKDEAFINWKLYQKTNKFDYTLTIPSFFNDNESLSIQLTSVDNESTEKSSIRIFSNKKQLKKFTEDFTFGLFKLNHPDTAYVADFNNDGLKDIKLYLPNSGCGAYNYYTQVIYLIQREDKTFYKISYTDLFIEFKYRKERDINGDGQYEIITQTFQNYKNHNYWTFNIYSIKNENFINVNYLLNYPIMVQLLYRENFDISKNMTRQQMKQFSRKLPIEYIKK